jgi:serine/threonine protein kinase/tetratricopeptide (TPR) repeat protein
MAARDDNGRESWDPVEEQQARDRLVRSLFGGAASVTALARYRLGAKLGEGGNGVVYRAQDPELDREVAVKLVRIATGADSSEELIRLEREAKALARLSHPNVLEIYDVGRYELDGMLGVFLVTALVQGQTLERWLDARRSFDEIMDVMLQAADGLIAAHAVGLVHRDFKPTNVMVGDDGRVQVLDFGLARQLGDTEPISTTQSGRHSLVSSDERLTATGLVVGTPAYMAPEQLAGEGVDARSDQYGFCTTLYEALEGRRPFVTSTDRAPDDPIPPMEREVPAHVRAAIERGLQFYPDDRFGEFIELRAALVGTRRRPWLWLGLGGLAATAAALVATRSEPEATANARCDEPDGLVEVWNENTQHALETAFASASTTYAGKQWPSVHEDLDRYARSWSEAERDTCKHEDDPELFDLELRCLDDRRLALETTIELLREGGDDAIRRAPTSVLGLPPISRCRDERLLRANFEQPPPQMAERLDAVAQGIARINALQASGQVQEAVDLTRTLARDADAIGFEPTQARVALLLGRSLMDAGDYDGASAALERAHEAAVRTNQDDIAADAARDLAFVHGYWMAQEEEGMRWIRHAEAAADRIEDPGTLSAWIHTAHAAILARAGKLAEAADEQRDALAIIEGIYGPKHREVGTALDNLAGMLAQLGEFEEATQAAERALKINESRAGGEHPAAAATHYNLGALAQIQGDLQTAREHYETALRIREKVLGPDHPDIAGLMNNLGSVYGDLGMPDKAIEAYERAIDLWQRAHSENFPDLAKPLNNLGKLYREQGRHQRALDTYAKALAILEQAYGPDHSDLGYTLMGMGDVHMELGDPDTALPLYERTMKLWRDAKLRDREIATVGYALARALWRTSRDRERALALAKSAQEVFAASPNDEAMATEVAEWLANPE